MTAEHLHSMLSSVVNIVQSTGFIVVAVAADNNQVNCKAFELLCGSGRLELSIPNPNYPDKRIFILFDSVHILKCIRNNWLNAADQSFCYPPIPDEM